MVGGSQNMKTGKKSSQNIRPTVLSIAGVDPSGGAGVLADIKTFTALGGYGMGVITAVTVQNTQGVSGVFPVDAEFVTRQLEDIYADIEIAAVKIGMLADPKIVTAVADFITAKIPQIPVVLDPVLVATSGDQLLSDAASSQLMLEKIRSLLAVSAIITPNLSEAAALLGLESPAENLEEMAEQGRELLDLGAKRVLMKAGHLAGGDATDLLVTKTEIIPIPGEKIATGNTHGTGCALSSAIAALRPQCSNWVETLTAAKTWLTGAIRAGAAQKIGSGHGPVDHLWGEQI